MERITLLLVTVISTFTAHTAMAQSVDEQIFDSVEHKAEINKKNTVGAHIGPGIGGVMAGGGIPFYFSAGIDYSRRFSERWSFCIGVEQLGFLGKRNVGDIHWEGETIEINSRIKNGPHWEITTIPVQLKHNFGKLVYVHSGMALNIFQYSSHTISGLGWIFGVGFERELNNGILISLNPHVGSSIFVKQMDGTNDTRYVKLGVSFGIEYKF